MLLPVTLLKAQPHLSLNFAKNSRGSGSSLGEGANFRPSSKASFWLSVRTWDERLSIEG